MYGGTVALPEPVLGYQPGTLRKHGRQPRLGLKINERHFVGGSHPARSTPWPPPSSPDWLAPMSLLLAISSRTVPGRCGRCKSVARTSLLTGWRHVVSLLASPLSAGRCLSI